MTLFLFPLITFGQNYTPGTSYFSENEYVEYIHGNLPIILSAPHGGEKKPTAIPDRDCTGCVYVNDTNTQELAKEVAAKIFEHTGCYPYSIINRLHRTKLDANRAIIEAADGNLDAEDAWKFYHAHIDSSRKYVMQDFGRGIFFDLHGHGHEIQRLELGYLLSRANLQEEEGSLNEEDLVSKSSIKSLVENNLQGLDHEELIRGEYAFGSVTEEKNYAAVPSENDPFPLSGEAYFTGGYNTLQYGSRNQGTIDAIQIECNQDVRFVDSVRKRFADSLAIAIIEFMELHYFNDFNENACFVSAVNTTETGIAIYPNPVTNYINIELEISGVEFKLFSPIGQEIRHQKLSTGLNRLNFHEIPSGIYQIQMLKEKQFLGSKIILLVN